jgi:hypothetical protein
MKRVELLTVEDSFQITGRGVVVIPDFSVPNGWKNRTEVVVVRKPDGQQYEATAQLSMTHFNISDPDVSIDKRWRVVVLLPDRKKEELPIGSKILVSEKVKDAILGDGRTR